MELFIVIMIKLSDFNTAVLIKDKELIQRGICNVAMINIFLTNAIIGYTATT